jgi:hypothetical protein
LWAEPHVHFHLFYPAPQAAHILLQVPDVSQYDREILMYPVGLIVQTVLQFFYTVVEGMELPSLNGSRSGRW